MFIYIFYYPYINFTKTSFQFPIGFFSGFYCSHYAESCYIDKCVIDVNTIKNILMFMLFKILFFKFGFSFTSTTARMVKWYAIEASAIKKYFVNFKISGFEIVNKKMLIYLQ